MNGGGSIKTTINSGVYAVSFRGLTPSSFKGTHPTVIIQTLKEDEVFYVIPLTSYTEEKWKKLRLFGCCKVPSTNSIARIDKMQIKEKSDITQRYYANYRLIVPTSEEMKAIHKKMVDYFSLSLDKAFRSYDKYYCQYTALQAEWSVYLSTNSCDGTKISKTSDSPLTLQYPLSQINCLSLDDVKNIVCDGIPSAQVTYNTVEQVLSIVL